MKKLVLKLGVVTSTSGQLPSPTWALMPLSMVRTMPVAVGDSIRESDDAE